MNPGSWIAIHNATQTAARNAALAAHKNSGSASMTHGEIWSSAILIALFAVTVIYMIAVMIRKSR